MVNKRDIKRLEKQVLDSIEEESKEQVRMALDSFRNFYSECDTRGMAVLQILTAIHGRYTLIFEIEQWGEEKSKNLYDYSFTIVNGDGEVVLDEADGELCMPLVLSRYKKAKRYLNVYLL